MTRHRIITLFVLLLSMAACTKEHEGPKNGANTKASFIASISDVVTKTPIETGENIPAGTSVGIFAVSYSGANISSVVWPTSQANFQAFNLAGTVNAGTTQTISSSFYYPSLQNVAFYSYYPKAASATFNSGNPPTVSVDIPSNPLEQKDYLWATPVSGNSLSPTVNFVYNHYLSLIRVKVQKSIADVIILKAITITTAQKQKATMSIASGTTMSNNLADGLTSFSLNSLSSTVPVVGDASAPLALSGSKFMFIPGTTLTAIKLEVIISGEHRVYTISNPSLTLSIGTATNLVLTISKKDAVISNWNEINQTDEIGVATTLANCYIVAPNGSITIPVNIKGNGGNVAGTGLPVTHIAASVAVLWQTSPGLIGISNFNSSTQSATVTTSGSSGNGVIVAKDGSGNVLWSWHIWVTDFNPNATTYNFNPDNNLTFMDRNLGATTADYSSAGCIGLDYQWGRKDPFPIPSIRNTTNEPTIYGSVTSITDIAPTAENNLLNTILYPLNFYINSSPVYDWYSSNTSIYNNSLWGASNDVIPEVKTIFDPCPAGWRVPPYRNSVNPWSVLTYLGGTVANNGITWTTPYSAGYWPGTYSRNGSNGNLQLPYSDGYYWAAGTLSDQGRHMSFYAGQLERGNGTFKTNAYNIRCVKEF